MWKRLRITFVFILFVLLALLVSSCFLSLASAATVPDGSQQHVTLSWSEYKQLSVNLNQLQTNSTKQLQRIEQLETLLQTASLSTTESNRALIEARQQLVEAKQQTSEQAQQLMQLNSLLEKQREQLSKTQTSLQIANASLSELSQEIKEQQSKQRKSNALIAVLSLTTLYFASR